MEIYARQWACAICGGFVFYDAETVKIRCKCGTRELKEPIPERTLEESYRKIYDHAKDLSTNPRT